MKVIHPGMKITAVLILTATATTCSPASDQTKREARDRAIEAAAEAMCRDGGRADALLNIVDIAKATPEADIAQYVYETASDIEQTGCADIVKAKQADWQKQDALLADVEAAAKK
jgi:hypothetical protein